MVPSIARQSVIIKCRMQRAYLLGNYEFYYATGLAGKLCGLDIPEEIRPKELAALLAAALSEKAPEEEKEAYLVLRLKEYEPTEEYDEQMKELLLMGKTEAHLWQVSV